MRCKNSETITEIPFLIYLFIEVVISALAIATASFFEEREKDTVESATLWVMP